MVRRGRDALPDLGGDLVHGAFALGEQIDDLGAAPASESRCDGRERVEQGSFGRSSVHELKLSFEYLSVKEPTNPRVGLPARLDRPIAYRVRPR